jgi:type II secretory pathway predicted ATPase ExeA
MPFPAHFNLMEHAFSLPPNSAPCFPSEVRRQILSSLICAIDRGEGVTKMIGGLGTRKTLLYRPL